MRENGGGASRITVEALISWLASRAFDVGAEQTVAELETNHRADTARLDAFQRLSVARTCVALAIDQRIVEVPEAAGYGGASEEYAPNVSVKALDDASLERAQSLHTRLLRLPRPLQDRLAVALHRWHSCYLRGGVTPDFFNDLGIGLECVFLQEESAELKHRLTVRAARLLGGATLQSRLDVAKIIGILYDARSRAVHRGGLLEKFKGPRPRDVCDLAFLEEYFLRQAILRMIDRGREDWDELVYS